MQCVILAAGTGTRLRPLTLTKPKPLVSVAGKLLLERVVESLPDEVNELVIVTGYLGDQIKSYCGTEFHGRRVTYIDQEEQRGTAHALWLCRDVLKGRFLFMFADDLHGALDIKNAISFPRALLVYPTDTPEKFGIVTRHADGTLDTIVEKPTHAPSNLASTGVMVLDEQIFEFDLFTKETNGEYYLTDVIAEYSKEFPIAVVEQTFWIPIGYPEDIKRAEELLYNSE